MAVASDSRRSVGDLLRELGEGTSQLARQEFRLARLEVADTLRGVGIGSAQVAIGAVLAILGVMALAAGVILLAGDEWLRDRYWLAALIVTIILGAVAAFMAKYGRDLLSPERLAPDQTVATLKEDKEWLKRHLTSGVTSS